MAKYIVDMDAFVNCLDFLSEGIVNGHSYAYLQNVKVFAERFPKIPIEETFTVKVNNEVKLGETDNDITRYLNKIANGEDTAPEDIKVE